MTDAELEIIGRNLAAVRVMLTALENELRHVRVVQKYTADCKPDQRPSVSVDPTDDII